MTGIVNIFGVIGEMPDESGNIITPNTTLLEVARQVESQKEATAFNAHINSPGGYVKEGDEVINLLETQKKNGRVVNTYCEGECASMATKLFLVGEKRVIRPGTDFMIHNPTSGLKKGDADHFEAYSKAMRGLENDMINFYHDKTGTSKETLKILMKKETTLTAEQAVEFGFATHIEEKVHLNAVAFSQQFNPKPKQMANEALTKKDAESLLDNLLEKAKNFLTGSEKALKTVQDANGKDIEFPDLEPDDTPSKGDKVSAPDGEHVMPSGETYVIKDNVLSEIKPKVEEEEDGDMEALKAENEKLKGELAEANSKASGFETKNTKLEEDSKMNAKAIKDLTDGLTQVKRSIASDFKVDEKQRAYGGGSETRKVWKEKK